MADRSFDAVIEQLEEITGPSFTRTLQDFNARERAHQEERAVDLALAELRRIERIAELEQQHPSLREHLTAARQRLGLV